jgi:RNA polymerase sporulation-specific sigma factor
MPCHAQNERDDLLKKNKKGDLQARDRLFSLNMALVLTLVKRICQESEDFEDLFQEGCLGLLKALQGFDPDGEELLSAYAAAFIIDEIRYYLRDNGSLEKISRFFYEHYIQLHKNKTRMERELKRHPRLKELALKTGLGEEEIAWVMEMRYPSAARQGESVRRQHPELDEDKFLAEKDIDAGLLVKDRLAYLSHRERQFIVSKYILGKNREETGLFLGISASEISALERELYRSGILLFT